MHEKVTTVRRGDRIYQYRSLVRSVRMDGKPRHEVLARLGRVDQLTPAQKEEMARLLFRMAGVESPPKAKAEATPADPGAEARGRDPELGCETRGFGDIYAIEHAWKALHLDVILGRFARGRGFEFDVGRAVFAMVANRLSAPRSKYRTADWLFRDVYLQTGKPLDADHLYEALTWLAEVQQDVELAIYRMLVDTERLDATAVFYDTTTAYFEGLGPEGLAEFGRGKDAHPSSRRQVLLGLVRSLNGWPVVHRVFPGDTADVSTVRTMLEDLVRRFGIRRFIFVGDRGMISEEVIRFLEEELKVEYVLATKLRGNAEVRDKILARAGRYHEVDPKLGVKEAWLDGRRYIVCRNQIEAEADARRRAEIVRTLWEKHLDRPCRASTKRAKKLVTTPSLGRYLIEKDGYVEIDEETVARDARYDGKWVLRTNAPLEPAEAALLYKKEVGIERDFRDIKGFIELRPFFHRIEPRVRAHVFVCVLAKIVAREIETRLHRTGYIGSSVASVLAELARLRVVEVGTGDARRYVRTRTTSPQDDLYRRLGIDPGRIPWRLPAYPLQQPRRTPLDHVEIERRRQERLEARRIVWEALREVDREDLRRKRKAGKKSALD